VTLPGSPASATAPAVAAAPAAAPAADPFGLWRAPTAADVVTAVAAPVAVPEPGAESFSLPGAAVPDSFSGAPSAIWTLSLTSGPQGKPDIAPELERLAGQVHSIETGLAAAVPRAEAFLSARAQPAQPAAESFSAPPTPAPPGAPATLGEAASLGAAASPAGVLPPPETGLALAFAVLEPSAESAVSFGAPGGLPASIDWDALYQRLTTLFDSVNRQLLHFAWVDTTLDGRLVARTTVNWGGDFASTWLSGLSPDLISAHCRSVELAMASRLASLRAILTASQIAGKIALALTTPLGPIQALSLAWQFLSSIISQSGNSGQSTVNSDRSIMNSQPLP